MTELPAYRVIYNAILKKIRKGKFVAGTAIPSENELAQQFGVSRMTARKSVDLLVAEGYLLRQKGRGTFPTGRRAQVREALSLSARLAAADRRVYSQVLSFKTVVENPPGQEQAEPVSCWRVDRLRFVDDVPAVWERVWIPVALAEFFRRELAASSLIEYLGGQRELGELALTAKPEPAVKKKVARALELGKTGEVLVVLGQLETADGQLCLWSQAWQATAVLPFTLRLNA